MTTIYTADDFTALEMASVDAALLADLGEEANLYTAHEMAVVDDAGFRTGGAYQVVYSSESGNGGCLYVGSGSAGMTTWTDASDPADVLNRVLSGDTIA